MQFSAKILQNNRLVQPPLELELLPGNFGSHIALLTVLSAELFLALTGRIPVEQKKCLEPLADNPAAVTYSTIHKAASRHSASSWNDPQGSFQPPAPFTAYGSFRNCTRQNHGTARNPEAGGFVNSTVTELCKKLLTSWLLVIPWL